MSNQMNNEKPMTEDFQAGMKQGAVLFGSALIETIEDAESEGIPLTSKDYKRAILNLINLLDDKPKIILNS